MSTAFSYEDVTQAKLMGGFLWDGEEEASSSTKRAP